ncbi:hypothetical protein [Frankia sp. AgKG'84/4]|uniref:hypothetical protein n=1 Tax=Frankia sp. AgKG'84/4 TaxID=573490 RepID=UPI00200F4CE5|nr:hypothetical protein [Frankia sp. AgKG'84/4]MCL9793367.1 hypothetical protein [Frankia sp. AgKG'84/4]
MAGNIERDDIVRALPGLPVAVKAAVHDIDVESLDAQAEVQDLGQPRLTGDLPRAAQLAPAQAVRPG